MKTSSRECATHLLDVVPLVMRVIRAKVRSHSSPELSIPQFRALAFLGRNEGAMLSDVSGFLGLTLPSASKLVDGLVSAGFATREIGRADRRRVVLKLTRAGQRKYAGAVEFAEDFLAQRISRLDDTERGRVVKAMESLRSIFAEHPKPEREEKSRA